MQGLNIQDRLGWYYFGNSNKISPQNRCSSEINNDQTIKKKCLCTQCTEQQLILFERTYRGGLSNKNIGRFLLMTELQRGLISKTIPKTFTSFFRHFFLFKVPICVDHDREHLVTIHIRYKVSFEKQKRMCFRNSKQPQ